MFRRSIITFFLVGIVIAAGVSQASAQTAAVNGKVELEKADGSREPVAGAVIEVFRTDIKSSYPSSKTNKKGEFYFAGFLLGGEYALSVSAPGASPTIIPGVRAGQENIVIKLSPGDGKKWTEAEVRSAVASGIKANATEETSGESAEEKAARAEFEKKNAEIIAKNKATEQGDATARKSGEEGFAALKADNPDLAISKFNEGIAAVPDFVGSTPILLGGKINALKAKGHKTYREGASSSDVAVRRAKYDDANKLFDEALASFKDAITIIQNAQAASTPDEEKRRATMKNNLYVAAIELHRLKAVTQIDTSKTADAQTVITEYLAFESDPARKLNAQMVLGDILRSAGDLPAAIAAYREVLAANPDHAEAMANLGLSLMSDGASQTPQDKDKMQEGLNYMQRYTEIAPVSATDTAQVKELKESVKDAVQYLKSEKLVPQKIATPKAGTKKRG